MSRIFQMNNYSRSDNNIYDNRFVSREDRKDVWQKLGSNVEGASDLREAAVYTGLNYTIEVAPVVVRTADGATLPTDKQKAIVRGPMQTKDGIRGQEVIGYSSDRFVPIANEILLDAFEGFSKYYPPATMGSFHKGAVAFMTFNSGGFDINVNGRIQEHESYFYVLDSKIPGGGLLLGSGCRRIVCWNTMIMAIAGAQIMIPIRHTEDASEVVREIAGMLKGAASAQKAQSDALAMMAATPLTEAQAKEVITAAWPDPRLPKFVVSLDTLSAPTKSESQVEVDPVANVLMNAPTTKRRKEEAESKLEEDKAKMVAYREAASMSLDKMASSEGLGINGYTVAQAVGETAEYFSGDRRDVAADFIGGARAQRTLRAYQKILEFAN